MSGRTSNRNKTTGPSLVNIPKFKAPGTQRVWEFTFSFFPACLAKVYRTLAEERGPLDVFSGEVLCQW